MMKILPSTYRTQAYLGTTRRDDLIRIVGQLERHEEAPDKLTDAQKHEIWEDPAMASLLKERKKYAAKIKECGYPTIKAAKGMKYYVRHAEAQSDLNSLKAKLSRKLLDKTIDQFHETVHSAEVERQMRGILPSAEVLNPSTIKYELEERATVARLLFQRLDDMGPDHVFQVRTQLVDSLVRLCGRQETPHQFKASRSNKRLREVDDHDEPCKRLKVDYFVMDEEDPFADITPVDDTAMDDTTELCCPFCKWGDEEAGPHKREHKYSRRDSRKRHVEDQHLTERAVGEGFDCPYERCTAFLGTAAHFLSHAERQHDDRL
jgi:hypothetical protein